MIGLDHVSVCLGTTGLDDIVLEILPGTWTFVIGPSGAGKTLLLETIAGLHLPDSGKVLLKGRDAAGIPPESRGMALVYQDSSLFPHLTVTENILFGLEQRGLSPGDRRTQAELLISQFQLEQLRDRYPPGLSGGEQQRVAIARALAVDPEMLLLDEPFAALDPLTRQEHIQMMRQLQRERKLTVVQVSHSREEAFALADRVAVIISGTLVQSGTCDEVFFHPLTPEIARFSGIENILSGIIVRSSDGMSDAEVNHQIFRVPGAYPPGTPVTLCVRGTDVHICPDNEDGQARDRIRLNGVIGSIIPMEHTLRIVILGPVPLVAIQARTKGSRALVPGQVVTIEIDATTVWVIPSGGTV